MPRHEKLFLLALKLCRHPRRVVPSNLGQPYASSHSESSQREESKTCKCLAPTNVFDARGPTCPCPKYLVCLKDKPLKCPELECPPDLTNITRFYRATALAASVISAVLLYDLIKQIIEENKDTPPPKKRKERPKKHPRPILRFPDRDGIPNEIPFLIIGGGTAAHSAAKTLLNEEPSAKVLMITEEPYRPYIRPPLSKEMIYTPDREGAKDFQYVSRKTFRGTSAYLEEPSFYVTKDKLESDGGVLVACGWPVKEVNTTGNVAILDDGSKIKYEKCLLATGSKPKQLNFMKTQDPDLFERISVLRNGFDFLDLEESIQYGARDIVIIGGGLIGSELLGSLLVRGRTLPDLKVTQVIKSDTILSGILPKYLSEWAMKELSSKGANFVKNVYIEDITLKGGEQIELILSNNKRYEADYAVIAVGVDPDTGLAETSKLEIDCKTKTFVANAEFQIIKDVYGAGDNVSFFDTNTGKRVAIQHHMHAVNTGRLAALNMMGGHNLYDQMLTYGSSIGDFINYDVVGDVCSHMATVGIFVGTAGEVVEKETKEEQDEDDKMSKVAEELTKCLEKALEGSTVEAGDITEKIMGEAQSKADGITERIKEEIQENVKEEAKEAMSMNTSGSKETVNPKEVSADPHPSDKFAKKDTDVKQVSNVQMKVETAVTENKFIAKTPITTEQNESGGLEDLLAPAEISQEHMAKVENQRINLVEDEEKEEDYRKGVVFYLKDDIVVGVVIWNLPNRGPVAKTVIEQKTKYTDLNMAIKRFKIHM